MRCNHSMVSLLLRDSLRLDGGGFSCLLDGQVYQLLHTAAPGQHRLKGLRACTRLYYNSCIHAYCTQCYAVAYAFKLGCLRHAQYQDRLRQPSFFGLAAIASRRSPVRHQSYTRWIPIKCPTIVCTTQYVAAVLGEGGKQEPESNKRKTSAERIF